MERKWELITYGGGTPRWRMAAARLARQARTMRAFGKVTAFTDYRLARECADFRNACLPYMMEHRRGNGYWLWKPFLLRKALAALGAGSPGVLYLDAGCELNWNLRARTRFWSYCDVAEEMGFLGMALASDLQQWCKSDVLAHHGLTERAAQIPLTAGGILFVANSAGGREAIDEWWSSCNAKNKHHLDDSASSGREHGRFRAHRHDQAILSCIVAKRGLHTIPDETYHAPDWHLHGTDYPIWALRNSLPMSIKPGSFGKSLSRLRDVGRGG